MTAVLRRPALRLGLSACIVLFSSGCLVSSLHPVYDDDSIVFDEALLGRWENREIEVSASVTRGEWRSYQIAFTDRFGTTQYSGHLTTIGTARFLNILPQDGLEKPPFIVATNGILQVDANSTRLRVREPDYAVALDRAKAGKLGIESATDLKQNILITAPAATVRKWLAGAVKDETLWAEWKTFTRSAQ